MATFVTLLLVPVLYAIFVLDLRIVPWGGPGAGTSAEEAAAGRGPERRGPGGPRGPASI